MPGSVPGKWKMLNAQEVDATVTSPFSQKRAHSTIPKQRYGWQVCAIDHAKPLMRCPWIQGGTRAIRAKHYSLLGNTLTRRIPQSHWQTRSNCCLVRVHTNLTSPIRDVKWVVPSR